MPISNQKSRRAGGQPGNKNALKHGIYASHYTDLERKQLGSFPALESLQEIHMLRARLAGLLTLIEDCTDEDRAIKLHNSLFTGTQRLLSAMRTQTFLLEYEKVIADFRKAVELFRQDHNLSNLRHLKHDINSKTYAFLDQYEN